MRALRITAPTKYRSQAWEYGGRKYHSKLEAAHAARLDVLKSAADPKKRVVAWVAQVRVPLHAPGGQAIGSYVCDFEATYADGRVEYHEIKGMDTPLGAWKLKHFEAEYPHLALKAIR